MPRRLMPLIAAATVAAACSGAPATQDETVQMRDQAVRDIREEQREEASRRPPTDAAEEPEEGEELAVEMFELGLNQQIRAESGLAVTMTAAAPHWNFEFDHHGRKLNVVHQGEPLYSEGVAFGHLYVISRLGDAVQLTLRSDAPPEPLAFDAAVAMARQERASRLGCEGEREAPEEQGNGTVVLRVLDGRGKQTCRVVIGRYTRAVVEE